MKRKMYTPNEYCVNREARATNTCLKCMECGRRFRKGILVDNTGREFVTHTDEYMRKENNK